MLQHTSAVRKGQIAQSSPRLERRLKRRKARTVVSLDPAIKRAVRSAIRRQGYGDLSHMVARLLGVWLRASSAERIALMTHGFYFRAWSHKQNMECLAEGIAEYRQLCEMNRTGQGDAPEQPAQDDDAGENILNTPDAPPVVVAHNASTDQDALIARNRVLVYDRGDWVRSIEAGFRAGIAWARRYGQDAPA